MTRRNVPKAYSKTTILIFYQQSVAYQKKVKLLRPIFWYFIKQKKGKIIP